MMIHIKSLLGDGQGNWSTTRLCMVGFYAVVGSVWLAVCIHKKDLIDIPTGVAAVGATLSVAKGAQSFAEK